MTQPVVDVALPLPVQTAFSYRVPPGLQVPERGARVVVPFGSRRVVGVALGPVKEVAGRSLKDVIEVVDEAALLAPPLLDLAAWVAEHYLAPPGECYRMLLPPAGIRASRAVARLVAEPPAEGEAARDPVVRLLRDGPLPISTLAHRLGRDPTSPLARLRRAGLVAVEQDLSAPGFKLARTAVLLQPEATVRSKGQAEVLRRLREAGGHARVADLVRDRSSLRGAVDRLAELGVLRVADEQDTRRPGRLSPAAALELELLPDQVKVLDPVLGALAGGRFAPFLLHGITGSGKTEVYFRAAEQALASGRGVLLLVPEIALTPMLVRAAVARFGETVSVLHSELSAGERHDQWWRIREGESRLVVGARSAVFAPIEDLGLLIVDEEHESAYKQEESPRYHARDVAVMRARIEGATVVLGTATPSVESQANALKGKYTRLVLAERVGRWGLPRIEIVDRRVALRAGSDPILTPTLREALSLRLERREQALLLLNRRGYASSLLCRECGASAACPNCSVALVLHEAGRLSLCHYCGHQARSPARCAACNGEYLRLTGYGTEKVVEAVQAALPTARVERVDRDRAGRRGVVAKVLAAFEAGELDILVGTQMIAKGHDFARVTLVGVVDADVGLGLPDFRAAERAFQLLTQVAGRAGRAELAGEVILQSHQPDHYALELACAQDYDGFFAREMEFRSTMGYPPSAALVNLVLRSENAAEAGGAAEALARRLREQAHGRYRVLGPAQAPLARLRGEHRYQILLKGQRKAMREAARRALVERYGEVRWPGVAVDVDPVSVM